MLSECFHFGFFEITPFGSLVVEGQKCFLFVSFGCFGFRGLLIISTLHSIGSFSRKV